MTDTPAPLTADSATNDPRLFRKPNPWLRGTREHVLWQEGYDAARQPADPGGLREAAQRLVDEASNPYDPDSEPPTLVALRAALAATPTGERLDAERLADWMMDNIPTYYRWMMTGWRETMRDEAVVLAGHMLDAARLSTEDGTEDDIRFHRPNVGGDYCKQCRSEWPCPYAPTTGTESDRA